MTSLATAPGIRGLCSSEALFASYVIWRLEAVSHLGRRFNFTSLVKSRGELYMYRCRLEVDSVFGVSSDCYHGLRIPKIMGVFGDGQQDWICICFWRAVARGVSVTGQVI
jgi:hypothetical protein